MSALDAVVFDASGTVLIYTPRNVLSHQILDEFNGFGVGSLTLIDDASVQIQQDYIVKARLDGEYVFAWIVEEVDRSIVTSDGQRVVRFSGRGRMSVLEDAVVYPQRGLRNYNSPTRGYTFVADDGPWKQSTTWAAPVGLQWSTDKKNGTTVRAGFPRRWPQGKAQWIWATNPTQPVAAGTVNWFRSSFTLEAPTKVRFFVTADNQYTLALDGATILETPSSSGQSATWTQMQTKTINLPAGFHQIAARVENGKPWLADDARASKDDDTISVFNHGLVNGTRLKVLKVSKPNGLNVGGTYYVVSKTDDSFKLSSTEGGSAVNITADSTVDLRALDDRTAGFLMSAVKLKANGRPDGVVRNTNVLAWEVATTEPRWYPAMIVKDAIEEAAARGVSRLDHVTFDFTATKDSSGTDWDTKVAYETPVGTQVSDLMNAMVDVGVDFWMRHDGRLFAWERRGEDLSANVRLRIGVNILQLETATDTKIKTVALVRSKDGWTQAKVNDDVYGRRETFIEVGRTRSEDTARLVASRRLARTSKPTVTASAAEAIPVYGVKPLIDFQVGDVIGIPADHTGKTWKRARVLSIALDYTDGQLTYQPELEVLA